MKAYTPALETRDDVEKTAADWVTRCDAGLTAAEQQIFQDWLSADARHADAFDRFSEAWAVFDRAQERGVVSAILDRLEGRAKRRRARRVQAGVAACLALGLGLSWFALRPSVPGPLGPEGIVVARNQSGPEKLIPHGNRVRQLPDGSIVELKEGAEIEVAYSAAARRVRMVQGEAYFRVEKDKSRPFFVEAHGVVVRAVGTAFSVDMQQAGVEVVVKEGSVDVSRQAPDAPPGSAPGTPPVRVEAGSRVKIPMMVLRSAMKVAPTGPTTGSVEAAPVRPEPMTVREMDERLAWRIPRLEFDGMSLGGAIDLLNRHNDARITLSDPGLASLRISGNIRADNLDGFVSLAQKTLDLVAERRSDREIVLRPAR